MLLPVLPANPLALLLPLVLPVLLDSHLVLLHLLPSLLAPLVSPLALPAHLDRPTLATLATLAPRPRGVHPPLQFPLDLPPRLPHVKTVTATAPVTSFRIWAFRRITF